MNGLPKVYLKIKYNLLKCIISHVIGEEEFQRRKDINKTACEHGNVTFTSGKPFSGHSVS